MRPGQYRLTAAEMGKRRWRTTEALRNHYGTLPAGTEVKVTGKLKGVTPESLPCPHCGVSLSFRKVPAHCVEEVTDGEVPERPD